MPASLLDLGAIRQGQTVARHALHKRERQVREAREALAAARARLDQAQGLLAQARAAESQAQRAYWHAVDECAKALQSAGHEMAARVRYCDVVAGRIVERKSDVADAERAVQRAGAEAERLALEASRAQQRVERAGEQVETWRRREQTAHEMHADLALEDDPPRRPAVVTSRSSTAPDARRAGARDDHPG